MSLQPFSFLCLNNDPQLEFLSVTMHCSNAALLALWLILCTEGHEDLNLSSWNCRHVRLRSLAFLPLCLCVMPVYCSGIYFLYFLPSYLHFIFTKSPILMSCHRQLLPTLVLTLQDGGVRVCYFVPLYASNWKGKNIKMCKHKHEMFIVV